jgi:hypothetical protein
MQRSHKGHLGDLAQLAARMLSMHKVAGSIPAISIHTDLARSRYSFCVLIDGMADSSYSCFVSSARVNIPLFFVSLAISLGTIELPNLHS